MSESNTPAADHSALTDQELARRENLRRIRELGVDPYPYRFAFTHRAAEVRALGESKPTEELADLGTFAVAGRVVACRSKGKTDIFHQRPPRKVGQILH